MKFSFFVTRFNVYDRFMVPAHSGCPAKGAVKWLLLFHILRQSYFFG